MDEGFARQIDLEPWLTLSAWADSLEEGGDAARAAAVRWMIEWKRQPTVFWKTRWRGYPPAAGKIWVWSWVWPRDDDYLSNCIRMAANRLPRCPNRTKTNFPTAAGAWEFAANYLADNPGVMVCRLSGGRVVS